MLLRESSALVPILVTEVLWLVGDLRPGLLGGACLTGVLVAGAEAADWDKGELGAVDVAVSWFREEHKLRFKS